MTWIPIIPPSSASGALARAYAAQRELCPAMYGAPKPAREDGSPVESIVFSHSLIPEALHHAFATFGALTSPEFPLGQRRHHEMIATIVPVTNRCRY